MEIDWVRMRLKPDAPQAAVSLLVQEQATCFRAMPGFWTTEPFRDEFADNQARALYLARYMQSSKGLKNYLQMQELEVSETFPLALSVYPITYNLIFPVEWCVNAYRSYLPDELPTQLATWRSYIEAVRQGQHQSYLLELYLYHLSVSLFEHYQDLKLGLSSGLKKVSEPVLYPVPLWSAWQHVTQDCVWQNEPRYLELQSQKQLLLEIANVVQSGNVEETFAYSTVDTFDVFLQKADDANWLGYFFEWVENCCAEGMGLYLDY